MSTIKSTLIVQSSDAFPFPLNLNVSSSGNTGFGEFGTLHVTTNPVPLSANKCGTKGAYVFVQAPLTNATGVGVKVYCPAEPVGYVDPDKDTESLPIPFATLYPGDFTIVPLTPQQGEVLVSTNFGSATISYFVADRGGNFGNNILYLIESKNEWYYVMMDAELNEISSAGDLGVNKDYHVRESYIVQNKGYVIVFGDVLAFFSSDGRPTVGKFNEIRDLTELDGRGVSFIYTDKDTGYPGVGYFDGDTIYYHPLGVLSGYSLQDNMDYAAHDGTVVYEIDGYNGGGSINALVAINKGSFNVLTTWDTHNVSQYTSSYTYGYANTIPVVTYSYDSGAYTRLQIFTTRGNLVQDVDLSAYTYDVFNVYAYGTGKFFFAARYSGDNSPWRLFNYDESTNTLLGGDGSWTHDYINYESFTFIGQYKYPTNSENQNGNYTSENLLLVFYTDNGENNSFTTVNYADIVVLYPGSTPYTYSYNNGDYSKSLIIPEKMVQCSAGSSIVLFGNTGSSTLSSITFNPNRPVEVVTDLLINLEGFKDVYIESFGDYLNFAYTNNNLNTTVYLAVNSSGAVLDTLNLSYDQFNWRSNYNSLFIRDWNNQTNYYFDTNTKRFVQLSTFYSRCRQNFTAGVINSGNLLLANHYNGTSMRMICSGRISADKTIQNVDSENDYEWYLGDQYVFFWFFDTVKQLYVVNLYDLNLNLVNSFTASVNKISNINVYGKRFGFTYEDNYSGAPYINMITPLTCINLGIGKDSNYQEIVNDLVWYGG